MPCVNKHCGACDREAAENLEAATRILEGVRKDNSDLLRQRDELVTRVEHLEASNAMNARTSGHKPAFGITCDVRYCASAIGFLLDPTTAARVTDPETVLEPVAIALGWAKVAPNQHRCPACREK